MELFKDWSETKQALLQGLSEQKKAVKMSKTTKIELPNWDAVFADVYMESMIRGQSSYTICVLEGGAEVTIKRLCHSVWNITEESQGCTVLEPVVLPSITDLTSKTS